jgi:hypothetical protein
MSALGQKQTSAHLQPMSALPPKADIETQSWNVRFVPKADILRCGKKSRYSITAPASAMSGGMETRVIAIGPPAHCEWHRSRAPIRRASISGVSEACFELFVKAVAKCAATSGAGRGPVCQGRAPRHLSTLPRRGRRFPHQRQDWVGWVDRATPLRSAGPRQKS